MSRHSSTLLCYFNKCRRGANNERGFTLIEMLVAISIFSLLLAVLLGGYSQGLSVWHRAADKLSVWQGFQYRSLWISRLTEQLVASEYQASLGLDWPYFSGNIDGFIAITSAPILSPAGRPVLVEFQIKRNASNGQEQLLYREGLKGDDPERESSLAERPWLVLLDDISTAGFLYYAHPKHPRLLLPDEELPPSEWRENTEWIPFQIQLNFVTENSDGERREHSWWFTCQTVDSASARTAFSLDY